MPVLEALSPTGRFVLSDGAPFSIVDTEGGGPSIRRITDRGPSQHGDSDLDFRLEPLVWPLGLRISAATMAAHYDNRELLRKIFRPSRTPIGIRWTLENGAVRQLDCHVAGRIVFATNAMDGFSQRCVVPLRAADPTYYDPIAQAVTFGVTAGSGAFTVPMPVPFGVGASTISATKAIAYAGTWRSEPTITIVGPITNPIVTNVTTGDKLDFTGAAISAGVSYVIDCRAGVKTVVDSSGTNQIAALSDDSDLATFALEADADAPGGVNSFQVTGTGGTSATEIYIQYWNRYEGL